MNIAIVGYGKMGKMVEQIADKRGIKAKFIIDPKYQGGRSLVGKYPGMTSVRKFCEEYSKDFDGVAIDFTEPSAALENIKLYCEYHIDCVVGTTGWNKIAANMEDVRNMVEKSGITMVYSANFNSTVQAVFLLNRIAAAMFDGLPGFDVGIREGHHPDKKDPSGTGIALARDIIGKEYFDKTALRTQLDGPVKPHEIFMAIERLGGIVGFHEITYTNDARDGSAQNDAVKISHRAGNRSGFANGALDAAEWLLAHTDQNRGLVHWPDVVRQNFLSSINRELGTNMK